MNCDPKSLLQAARCYRCIPAGVMRSAIISQLCRWANAGGGPPPCVGLCWTPETEQVRWSEDGGITWQTGNLAFFKANATEANVTHLDFLTPASHIATLTGLSTLPSLTSIDVSGTNLTSLDCSACLSLVSIAGDVLPLLQTVNVTGCVSLDSISMSNNPNLTAFVGILTCAALTLLTANTDDISGTLDLTNLSNLLGVQVGDNHNLTNITLTGCSGMLGIGCGGCDILSINATPCIVLTNILCSNQVTGLQVLSLPNSVSLGFVDASGNALPTAQVDAIYSILNTFDQPLGGEVYLDGGTSGPPTGGCANADIVNLQLGGWTVGGCP